MIYSDFLVLKFFRDIVVYEKITLIKKLCSPHLTRFRISMSPRTHSNTLYNPRSLKRVKTFIVYIRSYILNVITFVRLTKQLVNKVTCVVKLFKLK